MIKCVKAPYIASPYHHVYHPNGDIYKGLDTVSFRHGEYYPHWIPNDFTMIQSRNGCWHAFGITHPKPPDFTDAFDCGKHVHEAEYQLFHCSFRGTLSALYEHGKMIEHEKILYPQVRHGKPECWAPCIIEKGDAYHLFWSPKEIRAAVTDDLFHFETNRDVLFAGPDDLRDPYIFEENNTYCMLYVSGALYMRTSQNLIDWSDEEVLQSNPFAIRSSQESPCLIKRHGLYYLFWCIYDGQNGCYDNRTFVFASETLDGFQGKTPIAMLPGHAAEIVSDQEQDYIVSVYYPQNGLNIAPLCWK